MAESNGFDRVAFYYDRLGRLVFGKSIGYSQTIFLDRIPQSAQILVLGGGTGWWLEELLLENPTCRILYVEPSEKMLERARKRVMGDERITFLLGTENSIPELNRFDAVVTFFVMDVFSDKLLSEFIKRIKPSCRADAIWLVTDFVKEKQWQRVMLFIMYRFFRITAGLRNQTLPNWEAVLFQSGLIVREEKRYQGGFIKSALYGTSST